MKRTLFALLIILTLLFGCAKQPIEQPGPQELEPVGEEIEEVESITSTVTGKGTLKLLVSDQENVISDFDSLDVTFSLVKIYEQKTVTPIEETITVVADLTELQGDNALKILEVQLPEASYSKIKLYASNIKGVLLGNEVEVVMPGNTLAFERPFQIQKDETITFLADIQTLDTGKVTTTTGLKKYELKPVELKSGVTPASLLKEITAAEMKALINEKAGKNIDRVIFMTIEDGFTPSDITINLGTKVIWKNKDVKKLGVIMDGVFDRFIRAGGSYEHTFSRVGSKPYNMKYYISNKGTVNIVIPEEELEEEVIKLKSRTVEFTSDGFSPSLLTVKRGTQVKFVNKDTKNHNLINTVDSITHSLAPNEATTYTYNELGEFSFNDRYDVGGYSGKVIVAS